jgi:feruloyl esterase
LYAPGGFINQNKAALLYSSVLNACDAQDGVQDGLVSNPAACHFNIETLRCPAGFDLWDGCLSGAQITTVKTIASPLEMSFSVKNGVNAYAGSTILSGANYGNYSSAGPALGFSPIPWTPATLFANPFSYVMGDSYIKYMVTRDPFVNSLTYDPINAGGAYQARIKQLSTLLDASDSLSAFKAKGGKVLLAQGTADNAVTMQSTIDYHQRVVNEFGNNATRDFMRFYVIPGFSHTDGAFLAAWNSVNALENWVEQGMAPVGLSVVDTNSFNGGRTRPLCEYPSWPHYNGVGYASLASSFTCVQP